MSSSVGKRAPVPLPYWFSRRGAVLESVFRYVHLLLLYHAAAADWIPLSAGWWWSGVSVQQQVQLKEESKHTPYYWKNTGLTVQRISHILWIIFWLNELLKLVLLFSKILRQLYACLSLLSLKRSQIMQIIIKSFKWDQKDVKTFLGWRTSDKCHVAV